MAGAKISAGLFSIAQRQTPAQPLITKLRRIGGREAQDQPAIILPTTTATEQRIIRPTQAEPLWKTLTKQIRTAEEEYSVPLAEVQPRRNLGRRQFIPTAELFIWKKAKRKRPPRQSLPRLRSLTGRKKLLFTKRWNQYCRLFSSQNLRMNRRKNLRLMKSLPNHCLYLAETGDYWKIKA